MVNGYYMSRPTSEFVLIDAHPPLVGWVGGGGGGGGARGLRYIEKVDNNLRLQ